MDRCERRMDGASLCLAYGVGKNESADVNASVHHPVFYEKTLRLFEFGVKVTCKEWIADNNTTYASSVGTHYLSCKQKAQDF